MTTMHDSPPIHLLIKLALGAFLGHAAACSAVADDTEASNNEDAPCSITDMRASSTCRNNRPHAVDNCGNVGQPFTSCRSQEVCVERAAGAVCVPEDEANNGSDNNGDNNATSPDVNNPTTPTTTTPPMPTEADDGSYCEGRFIKAEDGSTIKRCGGTTICQIRDGKTLCDRENCASSGMTRCLVKEGWPENGRVEKYYTVEIDVCDQFIDATKKDCTPGLGCYIPDNDFSECRSSVADENSPFYLRGCYSQTSYYTPEWQTHMPADCRCGNYSAAEPEHTSWEACGPASWRMENGLGANLDVTLGDGPQLAFVRPLGGSGFFAHRGTTDTQRKRIIFTGRFYDENGALDEARSGLYEAGERIAPLVR